jgi:predicted transcriptional regulator
MKPVQYTSTLSPELMNLLDRYAGKFKVPKNRIIEDALQAYFENLKKAEYTLSFRKAAKEEEISLLAEEGLEDYLKILDSE